MIQRKVILSPYRERSCFRSEFWTFRTLLYNFIWNC